MRQWRVEIIVPSLVWLLILVTSLAGLATACAVPATAPTTAISVPTATYVPATATTTSTATSVPTVTAAPVTPTIAPTATALPTATSTAISIPTAVPTKTSTVTATATKPSATATASPVASPQATAVSSSGATAKLDMDKIFPPGKGRDLVLFNCTGCHSFVRVITGQRTLGAWQVVRGSMQSRVSSLSDQEIDDLFAYLEANFNDSKPAPDLPDWLASQY